MATEAGKPLPPNVKGEPRHTPIRRPLVVNGVSRYAVKGHDVIQEEGEFTVTYHGCVEDNGDSWAIDMRNCLVTWR